MYYYQHIPMRVLCLCSFFHSVSRRSKARFCPVPLGLQRRCGREPLEPEKIRAEVRWEVRFSHNSRVTWQDIRHDKAVQFDVLLMWIYIIYYIYYIYIYILDLVKGGFCSIWNFSAMARSKLLRKPKLLSNRLRMALRFFSTVKWVTRWWEVHHSDMFFYTHKNPLW